MTNISKEQVRQYLELSLELAEKALQLGNYPIGAVLVNQDNTIVATEINECSTEQDITAHAEILALRKLGGAVDKHSVGQHILFTSLEPCYGCSFFLARTNVTQIYSALKDPHKGGISNLRDQEQFASFFAKSTLVNEPLADLADHSRALMRQYFEQIGNTTAAAYYQRRRSHRSDL